MPDELQHQMGWQVDGRAASALTGVSDIMTLSPRRHAEPQLLNAPLRGLHDPLARTGPGSCYRGPAHRCQDDGLADQRSSPGDRPPATAAGCGGHLRSEHGRGQAFKHPHDGQAGCPRCELRFDHPMLFAVPHPAQTRPDWSLHRPSRIAQHLDAGVAPWPTSVGSGAAQLALSGPTAGPGSEEVRRLFTHERS